MNTSPPVAADVTVLIPTLGRDLLEGCLDAIARGDSWPAALLVVDQGSSDDVATWVAALCAQGLNAYHVPQNGRGIARAMNHGMIQVRTPITAVTHDDCRPTADWLSTIACRVRDWGGDVVVTGRVVPEAGSEVPSVIDASRGAVYRRPLRDRDVLFPACMAFTTSLWHRVGPMDEDPLLARASEDNEWAYRVLRAGVPIVYDPSPAVEHVAWRDERARADTEWVYARASGAFYGKYLRRPRAHFAARAASGLAHGAWWWTRGAATHNSALRERGRAGVLGLLGGLWAGLTRGRRPIRTTGHPPRRTS